MERQLPSGNLFRALYDSDLKGSPCWFAQGGALTRPSDMGLPCNAFQLRRSTFCRTCQRTAGEG